MKMNMEKYHLNSISTEKNGIVFAIETLSTQTNIYNESNRQGFRI